jgi:PAS domain S-box-containing protein
MKKILTNASMEQKYEDQLLQNYEFYKTAFELSKDPKLVLENCKIVRFNPAAMGFLESEDPDDIFEHELHEFLIDGGIDHEFIRKNCAGNDFVELKLKTCKGNIIPVSVNFDTVSRNGMERSIATIQDISDRIINQKNLEKSNKFINTILENLPIGISVKTIEEKIPKYMNNNFSKIIGHPVNVISNFEQFLKAAHPDPLDLEVVRVTILKELADNKYVSGISEIKDEEGKNRFIEYTMFLMEEQDNMITMVRNATQETKDRAWLNVKSKAVKAIPNPIVITDKEGIILWTNPAFYQIYGYTKEEVLGNTPRIIKSNKHELKFYEDMWKKILSGEIWRGEIINKHKDGTEIIDHQTITPVRTDGGDITHFIAIKNLTDEELDYVVN